MGYGLFYSFPKYVRSWDVSVLGHLCLVLFLCCVVCPCRGLKWASPQHPRCGSRLTYGTRPPLPYFISHNKDKPEDLTATAAAVNAVLTILSGILRMSPCCR